MISCFDCPVKRKQFSVLAASACPATRLLQHQGQAIVSGPFPFQSTHAGSEGSLQLSKLLLSSQVLLPSLVWDTEDPTPR